MTTSTPLRTVRRAARPAASVVEFLVHSGIFISLAAASVAVSTIVLTDLPLRPGPPFIVFAVTMFVYSLDRVTDVEEDTQNVPGRAAVTRRYGRALLAVGVLFYLTAICLAVLWNVPKVQYMVLPLVVGVLYSLLRVKQYFLVKNLLVGVSWGVIPLGVGVYYDMLWAFEIAFLFAFFSAMLTIAAIVFDVKDIPGDRAEGIRTVPTAFGPRQTRVVAIVATSIVSAVVIGLLVTGALPGEYTVLLAFTGYVVLYSVFATPDRGPLFYGFVVDGEHVFLAALLLAWKFVL